MHLKSKLISKHRMRSSCKTWHRSNVNKMALCWLLYSKYSTMWDSEWDCLWKQKEVRRLTLSVMSVQSCQWNSACRRASEGERQAPSYVTRNRRPRSLTGWRWVASNACPDPSPVAPFEEKAGWGPQPVWLFWEDKCSCPFPASRHDSKSVQPWV